MSVKDNEAIYDEQIDPLMMRIIDICKDHQIPMFATFQYVESEDGGMAGFCTTRIPVDGESSLFAKLNLVAYDGWEVVAPFAALTISTRPL